MRHARKIFRATWLGLWIGIFAAGPLLAYTIVLKDGNTIQAREKHEVRNGKAYIVLTNGTETVLDANQIDVQKTERANQGGDLGGTGILIDEGSSTQPPPPQTDRDRRRSLADMIRSGDAGPTNQPSTTRTRPPSPSRAAESAGVPRTSAGYVDLTALRRRPLENERLSTALRRHFVQKNIDPVTVYQGTSPSNPLVQVTATSEAAVLRAMVVGADALLQLQDRFADGLETLELLVVTPDGGRGGQFQMTPAMANELIGQQIGVDEFFLRYVLF